MSLFKAKVSVRQARRQVLAGKARAANQIGRLGVKIGKHYSSGVLSKAFKRKHRPYAVRRGRPLLSPQYINQESGAFKRDWGSFRTPTGTKIVNYNEVAGYLAGEDRPRSTMFRRPVDDAVEAELARDAPKIVENEITR